MLDEEHDVENELASNIGNNEPNDNLSINEFLTGVVTDEEDGPNRSDEEIETEEILGEGDDEIINLAMNESIPDSASDDNTSDVNSMDHSYVNNVDNEIWDEHDDETSHNEDINRIDGLIDELRSNVVNERTEKLQRPRRAAAGAGLERLEMSFGGKEYASVNTQLLQSDTASKLRKVGKSFLKVVLNQMSVKEGLRKHGSRAFAALLKEMKQLHDGAMPGKPVIMPIAHDDLTKKEKREALEAISLLKEKRDGKIKCRTCANGKKQRRYVKDTDDWSSPTASLEAILSTLLIDVIEGRSVTIADIPGAYLHADMPKDRTLLLKLTNELVEIMCEIDPQYEKEVKMEGNTKVLYVKIVRALYGCLESALLWYEHYSKSLIEMGFTLNPYEPCVANKIVNGSACTVVFYVDDNKISHRDPIVVQNVVAELSKRFGSITTHKVEVDKPFDFLGMNITLRRDKKFEVEMCKQLNEAIMWFGEEVKDRPKTPANKNLFETSVDADPLDEKRAEVFHSVVAKLLYISKRARPDIEVAISYLCRRVSCSNQADWEKLRRVIGYISGTINETRTIGAKNIQDLYTWVDAAYAVHDDFRSQTGGCMSFGHGLIHHKSSIQKLNTKSSTEAEVVATSEYVPHNIWLKNFLLEQGYFINNNTLFQDNQSAIRMESNGNKSCTGNSRHVNIRYFFVKDRIDKKELKVCYCPTHVMLADFFTKPLQGSLFKFYKEIIMGRRPTYHIIKDAVEMKERVGIQRYEEKLISSISDATYAKNEERSDIHT